MKRLATVSSSLPKLVLVCRHRRRTRRHPASSALPRRSRRRPGPPSLLVTPEDCSGFLYGPIAKRAAGLFPAPEFSLRLPGDRRMPSFLLCADADLLEPESLSLGRPASREGDYLGRRQPCSGPLLDFYRARDRQRNWLPGSAEADYFLWVHPDNAARRLPPDPFSTGWRGRWPARAVLDHSQGWWFSATT